MVATPSHSDRERAWRWRDDALGPVEFLTARYVTQVYAPHTHDGYAVGVVEDGVEAFHYRGALRVAPAGSVIALDPGEIHTGQAARGAGGWQYRMMYVPASLVNTALGYDAAAYGAATFESPVIDDPQLAGALARMHRAIERGAGTLEEGARVVEVIAQLVARHAARRRAHRPPFADHRAALLVRDYIEAHYHRNLSLAELSRAAGLSPFHLSRVFRAATGLPPHRYLEQVRVRHARELLRGSHALSRVALDAGFIDQSHLTRHFKRHYGVTPGQYRRATRPARSA